MAAVLALVIIWIFGTPQHFGFAGVSYVLFQNVSASI
jgi:hypothetical protein